jgi:hypothetical protein
MGNACGHGPHPITSGERKLLIKRVAETGTRLANVVGRGRRSLTDFLPEVRGEAHGHPHSPEPVCYLPAFPSSEVELPHVFSKQLSDLSSAEPENK